MIDWNDNAKAAVNAYNDWALENDLGIHTFFEHLTNNGHTQQKTVADAVDQECEKWTHTWNGRKCVVVFADDYMSWVKGEGLNKLVPMDSLKPIKPKLTKAQAWDKICESEHEFDIVNRIKQMYDII